jgi:predicted phage baseplate assembly protein
VSLPAPNLDDRRFQDLVDDAKRLVQQHCPEWSDHNVSDPGVTLIELFAWMTDQLLYRLNRVPDLNYIKYLELLGITLFPPTAAQTELTFRLSARRTDTLHIPRGTEVSTVRTERDEEITFTTDEELAIVPCHLQALASANSKGESHSHGGELDADRRIPCFSERPQPGEAFLVGLSNPVPSCTVVVRLDCQIEGRGVKPEDPPLVWEAWDGTDWMECEVELDETRALNSAGDIVLHVPAGHRSSEVGEERAGWLRCRLLEPRERQPFYGASPEVASVDTFTIGGTVGASHAAIVGNEVIGISEGVPGQRFALEQRPVVPGGRPRVLESSTDPDKGWEEWLEVTSFANSGKASRHFTLDQVAGEVVLGPAVREADGTMRYYGAVPPKGAALRMREYLTGGGPRGNVSKGALTVLRKPIAYLASVENRRHASGGVEGEDVANAKVRGPIALRTGDRAVTAEDYEQLAQEAAPELARVACIPAENEADAGSLRVVVVPKVGEVEGRVRFEELGPRAELLERIKRFLDARRVIGVRIAVGPPLYQGVTVVAKLRPRPDANLALLERRALESLYRYFGPVAGGPAGTGWPFGKAVLASEVIPLLQDVPGCDAVEAVRLFAADPTTGDRTGPEDRIELPAYGLAFGYEHRVVVEGA